jgi:hypothetical protein
MKHGIALVSTFLSFILFVSFDAPEYWHMAGSATGKYQAVIEDAGPDGKNIVTIKSIDERIKGFSTLMQICKPGKFAGKRVRMKGWMKTKDVESWAGFWLRIDINLGFDNMHEGKNNREIKGTTDWKEYAIVLDVPDSAVNLAYGALLNGTGQIWFKNLSFEVVDTTVATTGREPKRATTPKDIAAYNRMTRVSMDEPTNLEFRK